MICSHTSGNAAPVPGAQGCGCISHCSVDRPCWLQPSRAVAALRLQALAPSRYKAQSSPSLQVLAYSGRTPLSVLERAPMSDRKLLMPKATAVWLVENTSLTFEQIAELCELHVLEGKGIGDGDVGQGIKGMEPW